MIRALGHKARLYSGGIVVGSINHTHPTARFHFSTSILLRSTEVGSSANGLKINTTQRQQTSLQPTPEVPDVATFLQKIGRNMSQHIKEFDSWDALVGTTSAELKAKGMESRDRRYLLGWVDRFSRGWPLEQYSRGTKRWGGERKRRATRAAFFGRQRAEERENKI